MFKQFIQYVPGADGFMILSLAMFLIFFIGVGFYLLKADRKEFDEMAELPIRNNDL